MYPKKNELGGFNPPDDHRRLNEPPTKEQKRNKFNNNTVSIIYDPSADSTRDTTYNR